MRQLYSNLNFIVFASDIIDLVRKSGIRYRKVTIPRHTFKYTGIYKERNKIVIIDEKNEYWIASDDWNRHIKPKLVFEIAPFGAFVISTRIRPATLVCIDSRLYITDKRNRKRKFKGTLKFHDVETLDKIYKDSFRTLYPFRLFKKRTSATIVVYDGKVYSGITWKRIKASPEAALRIATTVKKLGEIRSQ